MDNLELKIYVVATLLLDLLDETAGDTQFKHKLKFSINRTTEELEKLTNVNFDNDEVSLFVTNAWAALEGSIDNSINKESK
tara:strand:- start:689 stop:931 length:243 start_codon:yes stop_codon:yes gene_type:complete